MNPVSYPAAAAAGLLSFLSPCVLPLIPGYLSFLSGVSLSDLTESDKVSSRVVFNAIAFSLGFTLIFVFLGASATLVGSFLLAKLALLTKISGGLIVLLGLHTMGLTPIKWLYREKRFNFTRKPVGLLGSVGVGMAFAFGWTPCIGPILAAILTYAGTQQSVGLGIGLLVAYSAGLAVPFILTAFLAKPAFRFLNRIKAKMKYVEWGAGGLLIAIGLLIYTDNLSRLASFTLR